MALKADVASGKEASDRKGRAVGKDSSQPKTRFIPVIEWPTYHPWPSVKALRWLIYKGDENGFSQVVRRVGRRVLIDEAAFMEWVSGGNCDEAS